MSDGGTDGADNALTGVTTDITDEEQRDGELPGFHAGNFPCFSPHYYRGTSMGFQLMVME